MDRGGGKSRTGRWPREEDCVISRDSLLSALRVRKCPGSEVRRPEGCGRRKASPPYPLHRAVALFPRGLWARGARLCRERELPPPPFSGKRRWVPSELVPVNGTVQSRKQATGCGCVYLPSKAVRLHCGRVGWGGYCTPAGRGMSAGNEPMGTEGFTELYFTADQRGRIENCLSEA